MTMTVRWPLAVLTCLLIAACASDPAAPNSSAGVLGDAAAPEAGSASDGSPDDRTPGERAGDAGDADDGSTTNPLDAGHDANDICGAVLVASHANAVVCGNQLCSVTQDSYYEACTATMQGMTVANPFCYNGTTQPPPGNPNGGNISASCDGPEDCSAGKVCRWGGPSGVLDAKCAAPLPGVLELCHSHTDCGAGEPLCCPAMLVQNGSPGSEVQTPYGVCTPLYKVPAGVRCDCPSK